MAGARLPPVGKAAQFAGIDLIPLIIVKRGGQPAFCNRIAQFANGERLLSRVLFHHELILHYNCTPVRQKGYTGPEPSWKMVLGCSTTLTGKFHANFREGCNEFATNFDKHDQLMAPAPPGRMTILLLR